MRIRHARKSENCKAGWRARFGPQPLSARSRSRVVDVQARVRLGGRGQPPLSQSQIEKLLSETRMRGLSRTIGQPIPGIDAFCAPVFDSANNIVLGITAMGPEATFDSSWDGKVAVPLKACALEISRSLGYVSATSEK